MLNYMIASFFNHFINIEIKIISLRKKRQDCETDCHQSDGHLPYLFEGTEMVCQGTHKEPPGLGDRDVSTPAKCTDIPINLTAQKSKAY